MRTALFLFLFLMPPRLAVTMTLFELSCENVQANVAQSFLGQWRLAIRLTPQGRESLHRLTAAHVGEMLTITANGTVLVRDRIFSPVDGGAFTIPADSESTAKTHAALVCPSTMKHRVEEPRARVPLVEQPELVNSPTYAVACSDLASVQIWKYVDYIWMEQSLDGSFHMLYVEWTPEAGRSFARFLETVGDSTFQADGRAISARHVQLQAQGQCIRSDAPSMDGFSENGVLLAFRRLEDALDAARIICPGKTPAKMHVPRTFGVELVPITY